MSEDRKWIRAWTCRNDFEAIRLIAHLQEFDIAATPLSVNPETVCVHPRDHERAREIIEAWDPSPDLEDRERRCGACGESNPSDFDACWSCHRPLQEHTAAVHRGPRVFDAPDQGERLSPDEPSAPEPAWKRPVLWLKIGFFLFAAMAGMRFKRDIDLYWPVHSNSNPSQALALTVHRDLDLATGLETTSTPQDALTPSVELKRAIKQSIRDIEQSEVLKSRGQYYWSPMWDSAPDLEPLESLLVILHAEDGDWYRVRAMLNSDALKDAWGFRATMDIAYPKIGLDEVPYPDFDIGAMKDAKSAFFGSGWTVDRLEARWALQRGEDARAGIALSRIQERGAALRDLRKKLACCDWAAIAGAILLLVWLFLKHRASFGKPTQNAWSAWSARRGYLALSCSVVLFGILTASGLFGLVRQFPELHLFSFQISFAAGILMLRQWLLRPRGQSLNSSFKLIPPRPWTLMVSIVLILFGLQQLGGILAQGVSDILNLGNIWMPRWAPDVDPHLIRNHFIMAVLGAPVIEELLFRGFFYGTLRHHFSPFVAAIISAWVFSLFHPYAAMEFLDIFIFGIILAYAYEKTRSLFVCMMAHALANLYILASVYLEFRLPLS